MTLSPNCSSPSAEISFSLSDFWLRPFSDPTLFGPAPSLSRPRRPQPFPYFIHSKTQAPPPGELTPISPSHWPESVTSQPSFSVISSLSVNLLYGAPTVAMAWFKGQIIIDISGRLVIGQKARIWAGLNVKCLAASVWDSSEPQPSLRDTPLFPRYWSC